MKVGTHKKSVLLLWAVLLASTSFGVYKNFTAIDTHTVHEKEIIQLRSVSYTHLDVYKRQLGGSLGNPAVPVVRKMKKGAFTSEENPKLYKYLERGKGTVCHQ